MPNGKYTVKLGDLGIARTQDDITFSTYNMGTLGKPVITIHTITELKPKFITLSVFWHSTVYFCLFPILFTYDISNTPFLRVESARTSQNG